MFDALEDATTLVLATPDLSKSFVVECDASDRGLGATLIQEGRPMTYYSKALSNESLAKSAYEIELIALVFTVQNWRGLSGGAEIYHENRQA